MPEIPGSATYRSTEPPEGLTKETTISESAVAPDLIHGEDWPEFAPTIDGLNPSTASVPGPDQWIVVHGSGYNDKSVIVWNGQDVQTEYVNEGKLRTLISMTAPGLDPVYVRNEGDHVSNVVSFTFTGAKRHG